MHDKAFDLGYMTITPSYKIVVSDSIRDIHQGSVIEQYFRRYNGQELILPEKFLPQKDFLEYHNEKVFEKWK